MTLMISEWYSESFLKLNQKTFYFIGFFQKTVAAAQIILLCVRSLHTAQFWLRTVQCAQKIYIMNSGPANAKSQCTPIPRIP